MFTFISFERKQLQRKFESMFHFRKHNGIAADHIEYFGNTKIIIVSCIHEFPY